MKENFNIEDLERKNIYSTPKDFYQKMQENVLRETSLETEKNNTSKVRKINFRWWAVAASVLLMISAGLMWNEFKTESPKGTHFAENEINVKPQQKIEVSEKSLVENVERTLNVEEPLAENITLKTPPPVVPVSPVEERREVSCKLPVPLEKSVSEEENFIAQKETIETADITTIDTVAETETMEEILSEDLLDEELAELTENMENDIYLELYN